MQISKFYLSTAPSRINRIFVGFSNEFGIDDMPKSGLHPNLRV